VSQDLAQDFRTAMRRFASTVSIATCAEGQRWMGITVTSVASVSVEPAALLVCINRTSLFHAALQRQKRFCINFLCQAHAALPDVFAGRVSASARFEAGAWHADGDGPPYLADAQANLFCTLDRVFDYATHGIFIGRVEEVRVNPDIAPLIYQDGGYAGTTTLPPGA